MSTHIRIVIDDWDREEDPARPLTLNVYAVDNRSNEHSESLAVEFGQDVPAMLRALADTWEFENVSDLPVRGLGNVR